MPVQMISSQQTLQLRQKILRPQQHISDCSYPDDNFPETFHLGYFEDSNLIGIATFLLEPFTQLKSQRAFRLRGMATDQQAQGRGIGKLVMQEGFSLLREKPCDLLWCNARQTAFGFYEKLGFEYLGPLFEIKGIGPHKVMYKYF